MNSTDAERARFVRDHYHRDATDPARYDLLLNSSRFSLPECTDLIVDALHRMQTHVQEGQLLTRASAAVNQ